MIITITGADDAVDPQKLVDLFERFPFAELALLRSKKREGSPRYPSARWLVRAVPLCYHRGVRLAEHLCGEYARDAMSGPGKLVPDMGAARTRLQINGYEPRPPGLTGFRKTMIARGIEPILQARTPEGFTACAKDARECGASVLYDPSGGRGIREPWVTPPPGVRVGYAGGVGPESVVMALDVASELGASWIDMESRVRDAQDRFDLATVREVLERAEAWMRAQEASRG